MAPATKNAIATPPPAIAPLSLYRFTVEQYQQMEREGKFGSERVELLDGLIVRKGPMNPPHANSQERVCDELRPRLPAGYYLRSEKDITLATSQPIPDVVIAVGTRDDYKTRHPVAKEVALLIEVSDSTLEEDQTRKWRLYAHARIPVYWIVNIPDRRLEVYTDPVAGKNPRYESQQLFKVTDTVTVVIGTTTIGPILVADLLPSA